MLEPGHFVGLAGDLGAGKTQFARGVAEGLLVPPGDVASPTFAIVYGYQGRILLYHADFYRLSGWDELYATGFLDLLREPAAILVEWWDRIPKAAPEGFLSLQWEVTSENSRKVTATAKGAGHEGLLTRWASASQLIQRPEP